MAYLLENHILSDSQYGFRPGRSCVIQLLEILDEWSKIVHNGDPIDMIYLDFSKAFYCVPHECLLFKLYNMGIRWTLLECIKSFLPEHFVMSDTADPVFHIFYTIKTHSGSIEMSQKNKTRSTRMRRPNPGTIAPPHGCRSDGERICEDGSCIARVELCPEEQLMNQNTVLIMVVVGLAVVVFLVILYCFQQRQRRANRQLGIDSGMSDDCDNESLFAPPPAYEEVINSINMYPATSEQRRLRQLSQEEPTSPMTPPPNYASALIILAQSAESLLSKDTQSNIVRRSVSLDQVQDAANNSTRRYTDLPEKNRHSRTRNIFRFSRQFSRTSATSNGNNNTNTRPGESPKIPRSPPPYPQSPVVIAQSPPPPLTPLTSGSQCNIQEVTCTNIEVFT